MRNFDVYKNKQMFNSNKFFEVMKNQFNNPVSQKNGVKKNYFSGFIILLMG